MDFNSYFAGRNELTMRILVETPDTPVPQIDTRLAAIGAVCLAAATVLHAWASRALVDPGYFAVTATFLKLMLLVGGAIVVSACALGMRHASVRARAREVLKERTIARLLSADRAVACRLAGGKREQQRATD